MERRAQLATAAAAVEAARQGWGWGLCRAAGERVALSCTGEGSHHRPAQEGKLGVVVERRCWGWGLCWAVGEKVAASRTS